MLQRIQYWDDNIINWVGRLHRPILTKLCVALSVLGSKGFVWFLFCLPCLIYQPWRLTGVNIIVALALTSLAGEGVIKHIVCRVRPCHKLEDDELVLKRPRYYSFPSGHTSSSFSVAAVLLARCWPVAIPVLLFAFAMGASRVYLRVHYLTDVLCGIVLGLLCGFLSVELLNHLF